MDYEYRAKLRRPDHWWDDHIVINWRSKCKIKVLMVTDGATYDSGSGYRVSRVLEALQHDLPSYITIEVTKAIHATGSSDTSADINNFRFNEHTLTPYDQIWIFAVYGNSGLNNGEATAIWEFMQGGGGVFATGDHENLGEALCSGIPRVRSMRRWYWPGPGPNGEPVAPAADIGSGIGENDTTTSGSDFDGVPQTIKPKMYVVNGPHVFSQKRYPHPVLCGKDGVITKLPDHMHEGTIEVPTDLTMPISVDGISVEEYPKRNGIRLPPEVIAHSTINNNPAGATFGVIGAYDGHLVNHVSSGVGRIIVDATWHHFWNMNVNQFGGAYDAVTTAVEAGLTPDPMDVAPAMAWEEIRDYFQNIAFWLARKSTQSCIRNRGAWLVAWHVDVRMAMRTKAVDKLSYWHLIGVKARDALQQVASQCEVHRIVWDWFEVERDMSPWDPTPLVEKTGTERPGLLNYETLDNILFGAQITALASITDDAKGPEEIEKLLDDQDIGKYMQEASLDAVERFGKRLKSDAKAMNRFFDSDN